MSMTIMDIIVIGVTIFSGFLALLRGFSREILSIASWVGAAVLTYFFHGQLIFLFIKYFDKPLLAAIASGLVIFILSLVVLFFVTMQLSNFIVQSRIGPLDRLLGLIFGCIRGVLICSFAIGLILVMTRAEHRPNWFQHARTLPILELTANKIISFLPHDLTSYLDYADHLKLDLAPKAASE